ncbi:DUF202 domain-containing protein [Nocardia abscessus]|uniref:DUF202 domain-containing protein n=1 Tax=Nocardia abscessus TaxID=120957 RepID=UPI002454F397|nr:DUF202 domain-containing protein [Nocardia abscessus]
MSAPHLSAERTALAWRRTAVAAMVVGTLFLHQALESGWRAAAGGAGGGARNRGGRGAGGGKGDPGVTGRIYVEAA